MDLAITQIELTLEACRRSRLILHRPPGLHPPQLCLQSPGGIAQSDARCRLIFRERRSYTGRPS
jgi:hypothetical protein